MSWETIYTVDWDEESATNTIVNESSITGHTVMFDLGFQSAEFAASCMNEVYNQVKKDIESGRLRKRNE